jgi:hypothetical protein
MPADNPLAVSDKRWALGIDTQRKARILLKFSALQRLPNIWSNAEFASETLRMGRATALANLWFRKGLRASHGLALGLLNPLAIGG